MSQAAVDCRPKRPAKVNFDEAVATVRRHASALPRLRVPLIGALGAVLAEDVVAPASHPPFDMSAMDGYALPSAATDAATEATPVRIPIAGVSFAGHAPTAGLVGGAYEITTGAAIPAGCDAVLVAERAGLSADGRALLVDQPIGRGSNIRRAGEDVEAGELILKAGCTIDAAAIGALACYRVAEVLVRRPPLIAVITTGDELVPPTDGTCLVVCDSNGPMVVAQACEAGARAWLAPAVPDRAQDIAVAIERVIAEQRPDIVVSTGGVSVGQRDCVPEALDALGATVHFHGVAMRPGKPVLFATLPDGTLFFGLPGNPVAAYVGFRFFVTAALRAMLGLEPEAGRAVDADTQPRIGTTLVLKANERFVDGRSRIEVAPGQQSHIMRPLLTANRWLVVRGSGAPKFEAYAMSCALRAAHVPGQ